MGNRELDGEIGRFVDEWNRAALEKDAAAAARLRDDDYSAALPDGRVITKAEDVALIGSPAHSLRSIDARNLRVRGRGGDATATFETLIEGEYEGAPFWAAYHVAMRFRKGAGGWRAVSSRLLDEAEPGGAGRRAAGASFNPRRLVPGAVRRWLRGRITGVASRSVPPFEELAFLPYSPGQDYVIPPSPSPSPPGGALPVPPEELWLGYNYPAHGGAHVSKMLEIVYASGLSFRAGDRVLDFGCGAGRMIRHLTELAATCEVWGTDISAGHVYWCKQNLSPPFNFATTTKVPHLPFEDGSFRLIYCGSVFTHVDDLADAWLLELRRVLAPDGRLYVTLHDSHTVELFESGRYDSAQIVARIKSSPTYRQAKDSFGMFTVGRGAGSQVFYDTSYFARMVSPMFEVVSVTPEAYFYQTAYLLGRKSGQGAR